MTHPRLPLQASSELKKRSEPAWMQLMLILIKVKLIEEHSTEFMTVTISQAPVDLAGLTSPWI